MKKIISLILTLSIFIIPANTFAQSKKIANQDIADFVQKIGNDIISIAKKEKISEQKRRQEIINIIDESIDAPWIARFVLGKNYRNASNEQRQKFQNLYREFLINTYGPKFKDYNGRKFTVLSVEDNKRFYLVRCEFLPQNSNTAIRTDFRAKPKDDGKIAIIDFIAEGISLIETHRSEFDSVISQKGLDEFLKDLTKRVESLKETNN